MTKAITSEVALRTIEDDEADALPFRILNEAGEAAITEWVQVRAKEPGRHNMSAWFGVAERAAGDDPHPFSGHDAIIEMQRAFTASGTPETLRLDASWFEWRVQD